MNEGCNQNDISAPPIQLRDSIATIEAALTVHVGQLPPPETVERYELVMPGAFDRILTMAEQSQQNKHDYNRTVLDQYSVELSIYGRSESAKSLFAHLGQIFGFATVIVFFSLLGYSMWIENITMFSVLFCAGAFAGLANLVRSFQKKNGE